MCHILYFGTLKPSLLYIVFSGCFSVFNLLIREHYNSLEDKKDKKFGNHYIFYYWIMFLAESSVIILYYVLSFSMKKSKKSKKITNTSSEETKKQSSFPILIKSCWYVLLASLSFIVSYFGRILPTVGDVRILNMFNLLGIILLAGSCWVILHYKYYRHHWVGIGIIAIGLLINTFLISTKYPSFSITGYIMLNLLIQILGCILDTLEKYVMDCLYYDPLLVVAGEGIAGIIMIGITFVIFPFITCNSEYLEYCVKGEPIEDFIYVIKYLFNNTEYLYCYLEFFVALFFFNLMRILIIQNYTPLHRNLAKDMKVIAVLFINLYKTKEQINGKQLAFDIVSKVLLFFGDLIFCEVLLIGICDLNKNTKEEISRRENNEFKTVLDNFITEKVLVNDNDD